MRGVIRLWGYLYELDELAFRKNNSSGRYRAQNQNLATIGAEKRFLAALTIEKAPPRGRGSRGDGKCPLIWLPMRAIGGQIKGVFLALSGAPATETNLRFFANFYIPLNVL